MSLMTTPIQTLFVTDVPYWKRRTGAQVRISELINALDQPPFQSQSLITQSHFDLNQASIQDDSPHPIHFVDLSKPPSRGLVAKAKWQTRAILNALGWNRNSQQDSQPVRGITNYLAQPIVERVIDFVQLHDPDVIVCEYLSHYPIIKALPDKWKQEKLLILDSHDVLWKRNEQFKQNHTPHWIDLSRAEEEHALQQFDLVVAIQPQEASYFASVIGTDKVITTAMEFNPAPSPCHDPDSHQIRLGYLASDNAANLDAALQILTNWSEFIKTQPNLNLVLAGTICQNAALIDRVKNQSQVELLGPVDKVEQFYERVDVVWNPIQWGTGLKIKNLEAMAHRKCLVTSLHGAEGLGPEPRREYDQAISSSTETPDHQGISESPFLVANSTAEVIKTLNGLNYPAIRQIAAAGHQFVQNNYGVGTQYEKLRQKIASLSSVKSS